ncbi:MAG: type II toxin-antitoxin system PemK/MazF family toxin [Oscillospiraceae bacterium]|uniref:type II toxin-antitoxin system PemK/MazF family toxin n=1 Tax=Neglectibacter timonensis TaxID=1776382 RepID=UPI0039A301F9|nr:type II toxin-antitoxin system PemK/MazF family toxin [Oscillospiraceae bacterium]
METYRKEDIRRGDIYYADLRPVVDSEQGGIRPVVILQNNVGNRHSPTVIAAAITSRKGKHKLPTHVNLDAPVPGLYRDSRQLEDYLYSGESDRVCLVFGLRRTGKTTMLRQAIARMNKEDLSRTTYIKARRSDTMAMMNRDLKKLFDAGFRYVFIDEVTLMRDFIDSAALFSDVFAAMGMKIVLSGTDSLGFWLAMDQELYDRAKPIHTTFIPYREYSRLLGIDSIDEYIRYGGTLRAGELAFDDEDVNAQDASFRDDESTRRYIDTAICKNIQHSLACYEAGGHFRHLYALYEAGELTSAINRIIEDMNHRFLLSVLTDDFQSHDLRLTASNLRKERDPEKRTEILDHIDTESVTQRLMELLDIRNKEEQSIGITDTHIQEIKEYLSALELIVNCPIETADPGARSVEHILFTQPGMRYCQAQALVHSLMKDETFSVSSEFEKTQTAGRILEEVRGRMLEDIVLLETMKAADRGHRVFKLQFAAGEFDMVIYHEKENCCEIFEIKHSDKQVPAQYRHLADQEKCDKTERRFGPIRGRYVLYRGEDAALENGVQYRNVERYLNDLPEMDITPVQETGIQQIGPVL